MVGDYFDRRVQPRAGIGAKDSIGTAVRANKMMNHEHLKERLIGKTSEYEEELLRARKYMNGTNEIRYQKRKPTLSELPRKRR